MKIVQCVQGSAEWHAARLGIPTASQFGRILTASGKPSAQADAYMHELVAERLLGEPVSIEATQWMERGKEMEPEAVAYYEMQNDCTTQAVGFVTTDDGGAGCSPDRLVGDAGGLEIKTPAVATHVGYMLDGDMRKYWPQCQGAMWVTGRDWWDWMSYNPVLAPAIVRVQRDEEYIAALSAEVRAFCERLDEATARLESAGGKRATMPGGTDAPPPAIVEAR